MVKRESDDDEDEDEEETTPFNISFERQEELLVGEGFGTDLEAENYFNNITRKNCKDDDENIVLFTACQFSKDCRAQASTESDCVTDIAKMCKYNQNWEERRCVNHCMAYIKTYRDTNSGAIGPAQAAQGLTKEDIERETKDEKTSKSKSKKSGKKGAKSGAKAGVSKSSEGSGEKNNGMLSSLLGGSKNSPGLLGGHGKSPGLLG